MRRFRFRIRCGPVIVTVEAENVSAKGALNVLAGTEVVYFEVEGYSEADAYDKAAKIAGPFARGFLDYLFPVEMYA